MKIATMVRGYIPAPRPADMVYAPIDLAVAISESLTKRGHDVTYFGPNGSHLNANVETGNLRPLVHNHLEFQGMIDNVDKLMHYAPAMWDTYLVREMFERANNGEFDLLHFHHPEVAFPYVKQYPNVPVVYTLHEELVDWYRELLEMYQTPNQFYISISDNQRIPAPDLPYAAKIYNGVDTELFAYSNQDTDYLLFAGRIVPEKGVKEAIQVAQQSGQRLLIIGLLYKSMQDYFDQHIKPHLNDQILYLGFMEREQVMCYYQKAKALLMPIQWEEPFGLTMIEAMSCGTPIIALNRGSVPEVVKDGKTGYIVNSIAEMVEAVKKIDKIKRSDCRAHVEQNFSIEKMIDGYEAVFKNIIEVFNDPNIAKELALAEAVKKCQNLELKPAKKVLTKARK